MVMRRPRIRRPTTAFDHGIEVTVEISRGDRAVPSVSESLSRIGELHEQAVEAGIGFFVVDADTSCLDQTRIHTGLHSPG